MTGMSQEERKAAGYTAEMIEQIEALDKGLQNGSVSMEEFTEKILRPSGRENLIQAVWNAAKGLVSVIIPHQGRIPRNLSARNRRPAVLSYGDSPQLF